MRDRTRTLLVEKLFTDERGQGKDIPRYAQDLKIEKLA